MINDNVLADRLNAFRTGKKIPEQITNKQNDQLKEIDDRITILAKISAQIVNLGYIFLKSLTFGYASSLIFSTNWEFLEILIVGFSIEIIFTSILNIFNK